MPRIFAILLAVGCLLLPLASAQAAEGDRLREVVLAERSGQCSALAPSSVRDLEGMVAAVRAAHCWLDAGRPVQARELLDAALRLNVPEAATVREALRSIPELQARLLLEGGQAAQAAQAFGALIQPGVRTSTGTNARRLYYLALSLEASGDTEAAMERYRELQEQYPASPWAVRAQAVAPLETPGEQRALDMAWRALAARNYPAAERLLRLAACPGEGPCTPRTAIERGGSAYEAAYRVGFLLYRYRRELVEFSLPWLEAVADTPGPRRTDAQHDYALAVLRLTRMSEAARALEFFARTHREDARADEARYTAAWSLLSAEHFDEAATAFGRYRGARAADASWWQAWSLYRDGRCGEALPVWRSHSDVRTAYWRGVCALESGDEEAARSHWESVVERAPWDYYAMMARKRLGLPPVPAHEMGVRPETLAPGAALVAARLGLSDEARALALVAGEALRNSPEWRLAVEAQSADWGSWQRAWQAAGTALPVDAEGLRRWRLAHPRFYEEVVQDAAEREGIVPEMIWAVMQKESSYNPLALSGSDAMGLMQVIPQTAEAIARRLDEPYRDGMLFEPYNSIRYGAWYLGALKRHFDGQVVLAVAGYHAGPIVVGGWLERSGDSPMDVWVEEVSADFTRDYIRRVLAIHARYAIAAGDPNVLGDPQGGGLFPDRIRAVSLGVVDF